ncbi:hypothetical protein ACFSHP_25915 [Novosphingobium panipatense]
MTMLADDATAAAVLDAMPCYPVPPFGRSPVIEALRASRIGHGLAIGHDGVMLILRRPWLALDVPIASPIAGYVPYGSIGASRADLRCGLIPRRYFVQILEFLKAALPNEAAAFILWNEASREFAVEFPISMKRRRHDWSIACPGCRLTGTWSVTSTATRAAVHSSAPPTTPMMPMPPR